MVTGAKGGWPLSPSRVGSRGWPGRGLQEVGVGWKEIEGGPVGCIEAKRESGVVEEDEGNIGILERKKN